MCFKHVNQQGYTARMYLFDRFGIRPATQCGWSHGGRCGTRYHSGMSWGRCRWCDICN
jgi:hypothetical protein